MRTIAAIVGLMAVSACAEPSPSTFGADFEASLCRWATGCSAFVDAAQCREALVWEELGRFDYLTQSVADGRTAFDAEAAGRCLNQIEELACEESALNRILFDDGLRGGPAACQQVYVGKVRNYDPCLSSEECAGANAVCGYPPMCMDACCVGSCRDLGAPPAIGEACTGSCEEGAYCARDPMTFNFTVCAALREAGASCGDFDACAEGLYCDNTSTTCTPRRKSGESCEGAPCVEGLQCYSLAGDRRCRTAPGQGDVCDSSNYPECARVDNHCSGTSGRCERRAGPGSSCNEVPCLPYAECDYGGTTALCVARASLGEACGAIEWPDGDYSYISCIGHLECGEASVCVEPEAPVTCELPQ